MAEAAQDLADRISGLRMALAEQQTRVMDFFRMWDADGSGEIEKKEFVGALKAI